MFSRYFNRKSIISRYNNYMHIVFTTASSTSKTQVTRKCILQNDEDIARFNDFFSTWNCRTCNVAPCARIILVISCGYRKYFSFNSWSIPLMFALNIINLYKYHKCLKNTKEIACARRIPPHVLFTSIWEIDTDGAIKTLRLSSIRSHTNTYIWIWIRLWSFAVARRVIRWSDRVTSGENNFSLLSCVRAKFLHTPLHNRIIDTVRCTEYVFIPGHLRRIFVVHYAM